MSQLKKIYLRYDSNQEYTKRKSKLEVTYASSSTISNENYIELKKQFRDYLSTEISEDLVEVTSNLKELFKDFDEKELVISIEGEKTYQIVEYREGKMEYSNFSIKDWDDFVSVIDSNRSININYKKYRKRLSDEDTISGISNEINNMMNKVLDLRNLEKKEENVNTKMLMQQ